MKSIEQVYSSCKIDTYLVYVYFLNLIKINYIRRFGLIDIKTIETFKNTHDNSMTDILVDNFYNELITPEDKMLLNLAFSKNPSQEELNAFLNKCDIEVMGGHKALMLSYFMKMHPNLEFSNYEKPRLSGLLKYFRFHNLKLISHFTRLGKALNAANIPVMILKGGAMKYLRPDLSRVMGDIDILVHDKDFPKAFKIAEALGYEHKQRDTFYAPSIDFYLKGSEENCFDLHRFIYMETGFEKRLNKHLFARAKKAKVFGVNAFIPSPEDILFLALVNLAKNLRHNTSSAGMLFTLFDCKYLIESKSDFDWDIVIENTKKTKTQIQVSFAVKFINRIIPGILPEKLQKEGLFEKEMHNYCKFVVFERFFFTDLQIKSRTLKLLKSIKSIEGIKEYVMIKPKYYLIKRTKKHPFLIKMFYDYVV
jgi:hypothetical protein